MKRIFLSLSLLLSCVVLTSYHAALAVMCPCVSKTGTCECSLRGECNCAEIYAKEGTVPADCPCAKTDCCGINQKPPTNPVVEVSYGELFDKVTILEIKEREILDEQKKNLVMVELSILSKSIEAILANNNAIRDELLALKAELGDINWKLWQVEDAIREKETAQQFDETFIHLARSVYTLNNARIVVKTKISRLLNSHIVEVKSYAWHTPHN